MYCMARLYTPAAKILQCCARLRVLTSCSAKLLLSSLEFLVQCFPLPYNFAETRNFSRLKHTGHTCSCSRRQVAGALQHHAQVHAISRLAIASSRSGRKHTRMLYPRQSAGIADAASTSKKLVSSAAVAEASTAANHTVDIRQSLPPLLIRWIRSNGGYVHPAIAVVENAPCGCRGVIAKADITMPSQQQQQHCWRDERSVQPQSPADEALQAIAAEHGQLLLIAVPEQLYMTSADAQHILGTALLQQQQQQSNENRNTAAAVPQPWQGLGQLLQSLNPFRAFQGQQEQQQQQLAESLGQLQPVLLLALLLAYERTKGKASFWYPYIATLPEEPPCAWIPVLKQQQQQQQSHHHQQQERQQQGHAAAAAVLAKCTAAANLYGPALGRVITTDDVIWAYGQVVSRAFGIESEIGLAPLIDMCNHLAGATTPQFMAVPAMTAAAPQHGITAPAGAMQQQQQQQGYWCVCRTPGPQGEQQHPQHPQQQQQQQQLVLAAGEELYISYMSNSDASAAWLNFGFVPPESL